MSELSERANRLYSALRAIPNYGSPTLVEQRENWIEPGTGTSHEFVLLERPEGKPLAYFLTSSRTLSADVARAFETILNELPLLLEEVRENR